MTLREMVQGNDPECVNDFGIGGVEGCPADYPYLYCADVTCDGCDDATCTACWNQEYVPKSKSGNGMSFINKVEYVEYEYCRSCACFNVCKDKADYVTNCTDRVEPTKYGTWIGVEHDTMFECSECGHLEEWRLSKYCPECGSQMCREDRLNE